MKSKQDNIVTLKDQQYFIKRIHVIEGQLRGVAKMIEDERTYEEVITQLGALTNSLKTVGRCILESYMKNNLDTKKGKEIEKAIDLFNKLV